MKEIDYIVAELAKWIAYYNEDYRNWSNYSSALLGSMSWKKTSWVLDMEDLLHYGHKMYDVKDLSPLVDELQTTKRGVVKLFHKEYIEENLEPYLSKVLKGDNKAVADFYDSIENHNRFYDDYVYDENSVSNLFSDRWGFYPDEWEKENIQYLLELLSLEMSLDPNVLLGLADISIGDALLLDESDYVGREGTRLSDLQKILKEVSATASNAEKLEEEKIKKMESLVNDKEDIEQLLVIIDSLSDFYDLTELGKSVQSLIDIETEIISTAIQEAYKTLEMEVDYYVEQEREGLWEAFIDGDMSNTIYLLKSAIKDHKMTSEDLLYSMSEKTKMEKFLDLHDVVEHPRLNLFFGKA